jgi:hypothetical protein
MVVVTSALGERRKEGREEGRKRERKEQGIIPRFFG